MCTYTQPRAVTNVAADPKIPKREDEGDDDDDDSTTAGDTWEYGDGKIGTHITITQTKSRKLNGQDSSPRIDWMSAKLHVPALLQVLPDYIGPTGRRKDRIVSDGLLSSYGKVGETGKLHVGKYQGRPRSRGVTRDASFATDAGYFKEPTAYSGLGPCRSPNRTLEAWNPHLNLPLSTTRTKQHWKQTIRATTVFPLFFAPFLEQFATFSESFISAFFLLSAHQHQIYATKAINHQS